MQVLHSYIRWLDCGFTGYSSPNRDCLNPSIGIILVAIDLCALDTYNIIKVSAGGLYVLSMDSTERPLLFTVYSARLVRLGLK